MKNKHATGKIKSIQRKKSSAFLPEEKTGKGKLITMQIQLPGEETSEDIYKQASTAEQAESLEEAEKLYKEIITQNPYDAFAYNRLMIVYRKQKKYNKELKLINKGIKAFADRNAKKAIKKNINTQIKQLSASIMKKSGLTDKKGNALYEPEPIAGWKKRKLMVEKRIG